jgi:hypothetical protein
MAIEAASGAQNEESSTMWTARIISTRPEQHDTAAR